MRDQADDRSRVRGACLYAVADRPSAARRVRGRRSRRRQRSGSGGGRGAAGLGSDAARRRAGAAGARVRRRFVGALGRNLRAGRDDAGQPRGARLARQRRRSASPTARKGVVRGRWRRRWWSRPRWRRGSAGRPGPTRSSTSTSRARWRTPGKQAASVIAALLIVFIIVAVVLIATSNKGGSGNNSPGFGGRPQPIARAPGGGGWGGSPTSLPRPVTAAPLPRPLPAAGAGGWRGRSSGAGAVRCAGLRWGRPPGGLGYRRDRAAQRADLHPRGERRVRGSAVRAATRSTSPMTMVSTYDGRVLWHVRDHIDLEADRPQDVERLVHTFLDTLPPALPAATAAPAPALI